MPSCIVCIHIKTLLKKANLEWEEIVIGEDISMEGFNIEYPHVDKTPFTVIDGQHYYELTEVAKKLLADGLIKAPTK
jgi:glutaredoxin